MIAVTVAVCWCMLQLRSEQMEVQEAHEQDVVLEWLSRDQIEAKYHYLPAEERLARVDADVASATKKARHPQKKGEFIYRIWSGMRESSHAVSRKSRKTDLSVDVGGEAVEHVTMSMMKDIAPKAGSIVMLEDEAELPEPKPKAKGRPKAEPTPTGNLRKLERELTAVVSKLSKADAQMAPFKTSETDAALAAKVSELLKHGMNLVASATELKFKVDLTMDDLNGLGRESEQLKASSKVYLQQVNLRLKAARD